MAILSTTGLGSGNSSGMSESFGPNSEYISHGRRRTGIAYMRLIGFQEQVELNSQTGNQYPIGLLTASQLKGNPFTNAYVGDLRGGEGVYAFCMELKTSPWFRKETMYLNPSGTWESRSSSVDAGVSDPSVTQEGQVDWLSQSKTDALDIFNPAEMRADDVHLVYFPMIPAGFNRAVTAPFDPGNSAFEGIGGQGLYTDEEECYFNSHGWPNQAYNGRYGTKPVKWSHYPDGTPTSADWNWGKKDFPLNERIYNNTFIAFTKDFEDSGDNSNAENPAGWISMFRPDFSMYLRVASDPYGNHDDKVKNGRKGWFEVGRFRAKYSSALGECENGVYSPPECTDEEPSGCDTNSMEFVGTGHHVWAINNSGSELKQSNDNDWSFATIDINGDLSIIPVAKPCVTFSPLALADTTDSQLCEALDGSPTLQIVAGDLDYLVGGDVPGAGESIDEGQSCCHKPWATSEDLITVHNPLKLMVGEGVKILLAPRCPTGEQYEKVTEAVIVQVQHECVNVLSNKPDESEVYPYGDHYDDGDYSPGEITESDKGTCPGLEIGSREISVPKGSMPAPGSESIKSTKKTVVTDVTYDDSICEVKKCTEEICVLEKQQSVDENTSPGDDMHEDAQNCSKVFNFLELSEKCCQCACKECHTAKPHGVMVNDECKIFDRNMEWTQIIRDGVDVDGIIKGCEAGEDGGIDITDPETSLWISITAHGDRRILWILKCENGTGVNTANNNRDWHLFYADADCHITDPDAGGSQDDNGDGVWDDASGCCADAFVPGGGNFNWTTNDDNELVLEQNGEVVLRAHGCCMATDWYDKYPCYSECNLLVFQGFSNEISGCTYDYSDPDDCDKASDHRDPECLSPAGCVDCEGEPDPTNQMAGNLRNVESLQKWNRTTIYVDLTGKFDAAKIDMDDIKKNSNCDTSDFGALSEPRNLAGEVEADAEVDIQDNPGAAAGDGDAMWAAMDGAAMRAGNPDLFKNGQMGFYASIRLPDLSSNRTLLSITDSQDSNKKINLRLKQTGSNTAQLEMETAGSSGWVRMDDNTGADLDFSDGSYKEILLSVDMHKAVAFVNGVAGPVFTQGDNIVDPATWGVSEPDQMRILSSDLDSINTYKGRVMSAVLYSESVVPLSVTTSSIAVNYYFSANQSNQISDSTGTLSPFTVPSYWVKKHWPFEPASAAILSTANATGTPSLT